MMDKNSKNVCDTSQNLSEGLLFWLKDHTDPQINPWATDRWKQAKDIFRKDYKNAQNIYPNSIDPTANREDDKDCKLLLGSRDDNGRLQGNVSIQWSNGDSFKGMYVDGVRQGWGVVSSPSSDIMALTGEWDQGWLEGQARRVSCNTTVTECWLSHSCLHGPARVIEVRRFRMFRQQVTWLGVYTRGVASGVCWSRQEGGGWLAGTVEHETGEMTGEEVAFIYPDMRTALVGQYTKGVAVSVVPGSLSHVTMSPVGVALPHWRLASECAKRGYSLSTSSSVGLWPLMRDPYEEATVRVEASSVPGGGEGLVTVRPVKKGEVVAFYNGVRLPYIPGEKENWETSGYKIFINADHASGERVDLPGELIHLDKYCATLGHKMNHSFDYNCTEWFFSHPIHGMIPCAVAARDLQAGDELYLHYGYDPNNCPAWYRAAIVTYLKDNSDLDIGQVADPFRLEKKKMQWRED